MDFTLIKEREQLISQREELVKQKIELTGKIKDVKVSECVAWKYNKGILASNIIESIGEEKFVSRKALSTELLSLDNDLSVLNNRIREINHIEKNEKNKGTILKDILTEILSVDQMNAIYSELDKRESGLPPSKVSLGIDNSINQKQAAEQYKKIAQASIDSLILVRKNITSVIDDGCSRFDKGYFLQCISPLNRVIPPLSELDKIKRNNHLK